MGRYVRRGTKGIALIDTSGDNPRLKYVFDVSDTGGRENSRRLNLWEYREEHQDAVTTALENRFGVSGENGLANQLEQIASKLVTEYWNDNRRDILGILEDSFLEEYDDFNVEVAFRNAATVSTTYTLMSRCGLDPGDYFEHEDFLSVFDFNTRDTIAVLGSAVSNSSEQILRQIAVTVKNYEREASLQRQAERMVKDGEQPGVHAERGLPVSQFGSERDRNEAPGQVRTNEEEVSAGAQAGAVESNDSTTCVKDVINRFGMERVAVVLANTVRDKEWDGRISAENKALAKTIPVPEDRDARGGNRTYEYACSKAHPGLINLFVNQVRKEQELIKEKKPSVLQKLKETKADLPKKSPGKVKEAEL